MNGCNGLPNDNVNQVSNRFQIKNKSQANHKTQREKKDQVSKNLQRESQKGNVLCIAMIFIAIAVVIFTFIIAVFRSHVNNVLYNVKLDMYSLNRSAIVSVNKYNTSIDKFSYNTKSYKNEFEKLLKERYVLDENFQNSKKLISSVKILEYDIYENRKKDSFTGERSNGRNIHTVMEVKVKPIILADALENIFVFTVHEDIALNSMKEKR